jgi:hypothetical protein
MRSHLWSKYIPILQYSFGLTGTGGYQSFDWIKLWLHFVRSGLVRSGLYIQSNSSLGRAVEINDDGEEC